MISLRKHLSYANVVATLALLFAMSGGALAAKHYLITSTSQISPKVLKKLKGRAGARGNTGPSGATGAPGATGSGGLTGITAGTGLTGGGSTGNVTLAPDFNIDQRRVTGSPCPAGISSIAGSGAATCATPAVQPVLLSTTLEHESVASSIAFGDLSGLLVQDDCHNVETDLLFVNVSEGGATLNWFYSDGTTTHAGGQALTHNASVKFVYTERIEGQFILASDIGVTTVNIHAFNAGDHCEVVGTALVGAQ
jgi:hypothetical protein